MENQPRVSVLMTVYNGATSLGSALQSVIEQDFDEPYEILVVDDGSTDQTPDILRSFETDYSNIRVVNAGRLGRAKALNLGLRECRAPYVAINDCDDLSYPQRLQSQIDYLDAHSDVVLVAGWARVVGDRGTEVDERRLVNKDRVLRRRLAFGNPFIHSTITYRKTALDEIGGFCQSQEAAIDYDAIERMARVGRLACVQEFVLEHYRGERQYFRARLGTSVRWRSAGSVAFRASIRHAWWMLPISGLVYVMTRIPASGFLITALHELHGRLTSRYSGPK